MATKLPSEFLASHEKVDALGRFRIRRELGRGGFATVYQAHDPLRNCDVALKVPYPSLRHSADLRNRFQREARAAASLDHPHINSIYEIGQAASDLDLYISSHYCPGTSLAEWLKRRVVPVSPDSAARLIMVLAGAVQHAHDRGILHRDLKPGNVLLEQLERPYGPEVEDSMFEGFFPRLCDFGLAKLLDHDPGDARTRTGILLGTPRYMAPEQATGRSLEIGPRTDLYSLGVILYELLVGRPPFVADTDLETLRQVRSEEPVSIRRLQPAVPRDLDTICMKCLEKEPERRYASARELESDLRRFLHRSAITAKPASPARRAWLWTRRHPVQALVLLVGMLTVVALPAGLTWHNSRLQRAIRMADDARVRAQEFETEARASERLAVANAAAVEQHMYSSDMRLADELRKRGEFAAMSALVDRHDPSRAGTPDRRGFEWWYLRQFRDVEQRNWRAHAGELNLLAFSADGRTLMTASYADQSAKTWDLGAGKLLATFPTRKWDEPRDHEAGALSPDGKTAVTLVTDNTAVVWDARTGERKARLTRGGKMFCARFSPDGRFLVGGSDVSTTVWRCGAWDTPDNRMPGSRLVEFSHDSRLLAAVSNPGYATDLRIYDVNGFGLRTTLGFWFPASDVAFSPDGRTLATVVDGPRGTVIQFWNPQTGQWLHDLNWEENNLRGISYSADGKLLASVTRDGILHFWGLELYQARGAFRGANNRVTQFQYSPDGRTLATSSDHGSVSLWNAALLVNPRRLNDCSQACEGHLGFNPKRNQIAVADRDRTVTLINAVTGRIDRHLSGNLGHIEDLTFSPDGQRVATVDARQLRCWEAADGRPVWQTETVGVHSVSWSPLGPILATGGDDHQVRLFDAATGREAAVLKGHSDKVTMLRFFPDGKRLASASYDNTIRIWDVAERREATAPLEHRVATELLKLDVLKVPILSLAIAADSRQLAAGLALGNLLLWDLDRNKPPLRHDVGWLGRYSPWNAGQPPCIAYSSDGSILGTAGPGGIFRAINRSTRELVFVLEGRGVAPTSATWTADASTLATVTDSNEVTLWNTATWQGHRVFGGPLSVVCELAFSGDGKTLAVATDRAAGLESVRPNESHGPPNVRIPVRVSHQTAAKSPSRAVTQDYIPWQSTTDTLRFWEMGSNAERDLLDPLPTLTPLPRAVWSPGRRLFAAASRDGSVWVWNMQSHQLLAHLFLDERIRKAIDSACAQTPALVAQEALSGDAVAPLLAFSPDGSHLAACDRHGAIRFWDTTEWHELSALSDTCAETKLLAYSPDGATLAVNDRGRVKLYDPRTGRLCSAIGEESAAVSCGRFSPDGRLLALGESNGRLRLIDMATRSLSATLVGHVDIVAAMDFTPDGRTLATGGWDATVRLWDVASKREVAVLDGHRGRVHAIAFSPDGSLLASGGEIDDSPEQGLGELFLWPTAPRGKAAGESPKVEK